MKLNRRQFVAAASGLLVPRAFGQILAAPFTPQIVPPSGSGPTVYNLVTGITPSGTRSDEQPGVGFGFIATANATCVGLGMWVLSGNSQTHTVCLMNDTLCTVLGSVTINTVGKTANAFAYASLGTSIPIVSGVSYAIAVTQPGTGDAWLNECPIICSSLASDVNAFYEAGTLPGSPTGCTTAGPNTCYSGTDMQYTIP